MASAACGRRSSGLGERARICRMASRAASKGEELLLGRGVDRPPRSSRACSLNRAAVAASPESSPPAAAPPCACSSCFICASSPAICAAERPVAVSMRASAPAESSARATSSRPARQAQCKGVQPSRFRALTSAPLLMSASVATSEPRLAVQCSGRIPLASTVFASAPARSKRVSSSSLLLKQAAATRDPSPGGPGSGVLERGGLASGGGSGGSGGSGVGAGRAGPAPALTPPPYAQASEGSKERSTSRIPSLPASLSGVAPS